MADKSFSIRLNTETIQQIRERFPDFASDTEKKKGGNSDILRTLIEAGLNADPRQMLSAELIEVKEAIRDNNSEIQAVKRNFSTILQVLLRNAGDFSTEAIEETLSKLKEEGWIV